jgi:hypothetical protein
MAVEGTPHYLWDYGGWENLQENIGLSEPKYILAHTMYAMRPSLKFVVILRNPADR